MSSRRTPRADTRAARSEDGDVTLRFLADEDFNNDVLTGLQRLLPSLDIVRVQDVGLAGTEDPVKATMTAQIDKALGWLAFFGALYSGYMAGSFVGVVVGEGIDNASYLPFYTGVLAGLIGAGVALKVAVQKIGTARNWAVGVFVLLGCVGVGSVVKNAPWILPIIPSGLTNPANPLALEIGLIVGLAAASLVIVRRRRNDE